MQIEKLRVYFCARQSPVIWFIWSFDNQHIHLNTLEEFVHVLGAIWMSVKVQNELC